MTDLNQIEAGDELTMDIEGEMDGVADKEITVEVVEVQDAGYIVEADGQELGRLKTTTMDVPEDANLRTRAGVLIARCYDVEIEGEDDEDEEIVTDGGEDTGEDQDTRKEVWNRGHETVVVEVTRDANGHFVSWTIVADMSSDDRPMPTLEQITAKQRGFDSAEAATATMEALAQ